MLHSHHISGGTQDGKVTSLKSKYMKCLYWRSSDDLISVSTFKKLNQWSLYPQLTIFTNGSQIGMFLFPYQHRETILISWGDFSKTNIFIFDLSASTAAQRALLRLSFRTLIPTQNVTF